MKSNNQNWQVLEMGAYSCTWARLLQHKVAHAKVWVGQRTNRVSQPVGLVRSSITTARKEHWDPAALLHP